MPNSNADKQAANMKRINANRLKAEAIISAEVRRLGWSGLWEFAQAIEAQQITLPRKPQGKRKKDGTK